MIVEMEKKMMLESQEPLAEPDESEALVLQSSSKRRRLADSGAAYPFEEQRSGSFMSISGEIPKQEHLSELEEAKRKEMKVEVDIQDQLEQQAIAHAPSISLSTSKKGKQNTENANESSKSNLKSSRELRRSQGKEVVAEMSVAFQKKELVDEDGDKMEIEMMSFQEKSYMIENISPEEERLSERKSPKLAMKLRQREEQQEEEKEEKEEKEEEEKEEEEEEEKEKEKGEMTRKEKIIEKAHGILNALMEQNVPKRKFRIYEFYCGASFSFSSSSPLLLALILIISIF